MAKTRYRIVETDEVIIDPSYGGMNGYAAHELGYSWPYTMNTILVSSDLTRAGRRRTVNHEKFEIQLMRRGVRYMIAHAAALKMDAQVKYKRREKTRTTFK